MRFRLRTLLVGMAVVAVALFLLIVAPAGLATPLLATIWVLLAAFLGAGIVFGRGHARAFCVGAMFPAGGTVFALSCLLFEGLIAGQRTQPFDQLMDELVRMAFAFRAWSAMGWAVTLAAGAVAVGARILFAQDGPDARAGEKGV